MPTGIEGFDEITSGGLPRNRTALLMGGPGCGKTVFAMQTLVNGIRRWSEPGVFVAFEENASQVIGNAATFGWDLQTKEKEGLFFLDTHLSPTVVRAGDFGLDSLLSSIEARVKDTGARRIVFDGIDVVNPGTGEIDHPVFTERVSTGIERLDTMLGGGYFRGSSALITGVPGTAKSTLAGAFAQAACLRKERTLYVSFDEMGDQIVRNLSSVGIRLRQHQPSGLLRMYSCQAESRNAEEHTFQIKSLIRQHMPRCVVIDPISAMVRSGGSALDIARRLVYLCKAEGITLVCVCLLDGGDPQGEQTTIQISTIADTWIQLSYVVNVGERNRALTIIKSRKPALGSGRARQGASLTFLIPPTRFRPNSRRL